jgi:hypothetical protein
VLWPQNVSDTVNLVERMHREIAHLESYVRASKTGTAANILGVALHPKRRVAQSKSLIEENERLLGRLPTASFGVNFDPASTGKSHAAAETDDSAAASATAGLFRLFDVSTVSIFARKLKNAAITSRNDGWELDSVQSARIRSTIPTTTEAGAKRRRESVAHFTKIAAPAQRDATVDAMSEARTVVDTTQVEVCCSADTLARHKQPVGLSPKLAGLRIALGLSLLLAPAVPPLPTLPRPCGIRTLCVERPIGSAGEQGAVACLDQCRQTGRSRTHDHSQLAAEVGWRDW